VPLSELAAVPEPVAPVLAVPAAEVPEPPVPLVPDVPPGPPEGDPPLGERFGLPVGEGLGDDDGLVSCEGDGLDGAVTPAFGVPAGLAQPVEVALGVAAPDAPAAAGVAAGVTVAVAVLLTLLVGDGSGLVVTSAPGLAPSADGLAEGVVLALADGLGRADLLGFAEADVAGVAGVAGVGVEQDAAGFGFRFPVLVLLMPTPPPLASPPPPGAAEAAVLVEL
jgi:hypothetical protein